MLPAWFVYIRQNRFGQRKAFRLARIRPFGSLKHQKRTVCKSDNKDLDFLRLCIFRPNRFGQTKAFRLATFRFDTTIFCHLKAYSQLYAKKIRTSTFPTFIRTPFYRSDAAATINLSVRFGAASIRERRLFESGVY